jgi:endonuclease/exonuclease/phosphatase (EEP) superfamily protein YafD
MNELGIDKPTTPNGSYYDHIIFKGVKLIESHVLSNVLTDHYPVVATFEL